MLKAEVKFKIIKGSIYKLPNYLFFFKIIYINFLLPSKISIFNLFSYYIKLNNTD